MLRLSIQMQFEGGNGRALATSTPRSMGLGDQRGGTLVGQLNVGAYS